jgi:hypothetical protein
MATKVATPAPPPPLTPIAPKSTFQWVTPRSSKPPPAMTIQVLPKPTE